MRTLVVTIMGALLFSCAPHKKPWQHSHDFVGHRYPFQCRQDLAPLVNIQLIPRPRNHFPQSPRVYAHWIHLDWGSVEFSFIEYDETLTGERLADTIHHELCHEYLYRTTGSSTWHS